MSNGTIDFVGDIAMISQLAASVQGKGNELKTLVEQVKSLQQAHDALAQQRGEKRSQLQQLNQKSPDEQTAADRAKITALTAQIDKLDKAIAAIDAQLSQAKGEIDKIVKAIADIEAAIDAASAAVEKRKGDTHASKEDKVKSVAFLDLAQRTKADARAARTLIAPVPRLIPSTSTSSSSSPKAATSGG
jgi:chromosome segregation ATPase